MGVTLLLFAPRHRARADQNLEALVRAAELGHEDVVRVLLTTPRNPARADDGDGAALVAAAEHGHAGIVCMLLTAQQHAARADCQQGDALIRAADQGHASVVQLMLDAMRSAPQQEPEVWRGMVTRALKVAARGHESVRLLLHGALPPPS